MAKMRVLGVAVLFLFLASTGCNGGGGNSVAPVNSSDQDPSGDFNPQRYIVKLNPAADSTYSASSTYLYTQVGFGSKIEPILPGMYSIQFAAGSPVTEKIKEFQAASQIAYIEPDYIVTAFHTPNDPMFSQQYSHQLAQSPQAWDMGMGSKKVVVAVIDTGLDNTHPDLAANVWVNPGEIPNNGIDDDGDGYVDDVNGWNFAANTNNVMADDAPHFHGTHTAGILGAVGDNGIGVIGASPNVSIMPLKFLTSTGSGNVSDAVKAIGFAIQKKVQVMSNSWGGSSYSQALCDAISLANSAGIVFVAAAGNGDANGVGQNNDTTPVYPARCGGANMVVVAASDQNDNLASFSNYGSTVQLAAPGVNIISTMNGSQYQLMSGTSMATPFVAGVVAEMMALRPDMSYSQILLALLRNVDPIPSMSGKLSYGGRVNAYKAMKAIYNGPLTSPTPPPFGGSPTPTPPPFGGSPTPTPTPVPTPTPTPTSGIAPQPLLLGQPQIKVTNPATAIAISYDLSGFSNVALVYLEISRPNMPFVNPNGNAPDPTRLLYAENPGSTGQFSLTPAQNLPTWGTYYFRVIPLNSQQQPLGLFSNSSVLNLQPQ